MALDCEISQFIDNACVLFGGQATSNQIRERSLYFKNLAHVKGKKNRHTSGSAFTLCVSVMESVLSSQAAHPFALPIATLVTQTLSQICKRNWVDADLEILLDMINNETISVNQKHCTVH